jgi:hypothetical protein
MAETLFQQPNFVNRTPCKLNSTQEARDFMNDRVLHTAAGRGREAAAGIERAVGGNAE